jgi:hypothetical protein
MNRTYPIITIDFVVFFVLHEVQLTDSGSSLSILFRRLFGTIKPQTFEVLDVTMVFPDMVSGTLLKVVSSQV